MGQVLIPLEPEGYYHIYNLGINSCILFRETCNFEYFLKLYRKYIDPVAETYAWVLMRNHFHFFLKIREEKVIFANLEGFHGLNVLKRINQQFSNLFNAYTKAYNKRYKRTGSLFEHGFRRKRIENSEHFKTLIRYIHHNPVYHGICDHPVDYSWCSYLSCISEKPTRLNRKVVMDWFDDMDSFKQMHEQKVEVKKMETWLGI